VWVWFAGSTGPGLSPVIARRASAANIIRQSFDFGPP
jgi:hypothetical protein